VAGVRLDLQLVVGVCIGGLPVAVCFYARPPIVQSAHHNPPFYFAVRVALANHPSISESNYMTSSRTMSINAPERTGGSSLSTANEPYIDKDNELHDCDSEAILDPSRRRCGV